MLTTQNATTSAIEEEIAPVNVTKKRKQEEQPEEATTNPETSLRRSKRLKREHVDVGAPYSYLSDTVTIITPVEKSSPSLKKCDERDPSSQNSPPPTTTTPEETIVDDDTPKEIEKEGDEREQPPSLPPPSSARSIGISDAFKNIYNAISNTISFISFSPKKYGPRRDSLEMLTQQQQDDAVDMVPKIPTTDAAMAAE